jgi:CO/xanthine dehydrogenase FAD-binding subunit
MSETGWRQKHAGWPSPEYLNKEALLLDLNTITAIDSPRDRDSFKPWQEGDAWLGGGTYLFSEQQPHLRRLIDLSRLDWPPLHISDYGLEIAATCTIAQLDAAILPTTWIAAPLLGQCCRAFLASFKIWNMATVGGNICLALPAGPMTSLTTALDGVGSIWMRDGHDRQMRILDLVTGAGTNALRPGEVLRRIDIPAEALMRRIAFRQVSLTRHGRSAALLIGTRPVPGRGFTLTVTAATRRPVQLHFEDIPDAAELSAAIARDIPPASYHDDMHGRPDWRQHVTLHYAEDIRRELAAGVAA